MTLKRRCQAGKPKRRGCHHSNDSHSSKDSMPTTRRLVAAGAYVALTHRLHASIGLLRSAPGVV